MRTRQASPDRANLQEPNVEQLALLLEIDLRLGRKEDFLKRLREALKPKKRPCSH